MYRTTSGRGCYRSGPCFFNSRSPEQRHGPETSDWGGTRLRMGRRVDDVNGSDLRTDSGSGLPEGLTHHLRLQQWIRPLTYTRHLRNTSPLHFSSPSPPKPTIPLSIQSHPNSSRSRAICCRLRHSTSCGVRSAHTHYLFHTFNNDKMIRYTLELELPVVLTQMFSSPLSSEFDRKRQP